MMPVVDFLCAHPACDQLRHGMGAKADEEKDKREEKMVVMARNKI